MTKMTLRFLFLIIVQLATGCKTSSQQGPADFVSIFNGKTLDGWAGDLAYWRAEDGVLVGEIRPETILRQNTFLIWQGGEPADFELKLEYRISAKGNSGVNYRSQQIDSLAFALKGYQADIDGKDKYNLGYPRHTGQNYEERGRQFLAVRGQKVMLEAGQKPVVTDTLDRATLLKSINYDGWNELHIIAKSNNLQHLINGTLMAEVTDNDVANRSMRGKIGVQVHVGPPMKVEFRNIRLKNL